MSGKALRPAHIPAARPPSRGDAAIGSPWFGPPRLEGRPWILTFVGTDESFVDVFFRGIQSSGSGFKSGAFPKILPVRDYAEPPRALIDGSGAPVYRRADVEPTATEWPGKDEAELDEQASFAEVLKGAIRPSDPDPLPPPWDPSRASWLRKLYLPMHVHFHVVACDLLCTRPGMPRIDPKRVIEAGMVVRRFVPTRDESRPRWEDWIPSPYGNGIWAEIADEEMKILGANGAVGPGVVDPRDLVFGQDEVAIRGRLGLHPNPTAKLGLAPIPLASVPVGMGEGNKHTARWGFLPVSSPDKERELPEPGDNAAEIAKALAKRAEDHLQERIVSRAAEIRARIRGALLPLLSMFRDALPTRPTNGELDNAYATIQGAVPAPAPKPPLTEIDDVARAPAMAVLPWYADNILKAEKFAGWSTAITVIRVQGLPQNPPAWLTHAGGISSEAVSTVMLEAVWRAIDAALSADTPAYSVDERLLVALLLWVRRYRVHLLKKFYASAFPATQPNPDAAPAPMPAGALGAELEGWLAANDAREKEPVPWPAPILSNEESDVHRKAHDLAMTLERVLTDVDTQGAGAGGGYAAVANAMARSRAIELRGKLGAPELQGRGIDVFAQPDRGLLVFPGPAATTASLSGLKTAVVNDYKGGTSDKLRSEAKALRQVVRPRYDADSLFAVWCYSRVAGRDPCEEPQLVWSRRTDVFFLAEPMDLLGLKPVAMRLPDLPKLMRDIPRMKKARALPFAAVTTPQDSGIKTGDDPKDTAREWGIAWICSFGIPVFTICAWVMFSIIFSILLLIPGFAWLLLLKFCIPVPTSKKA